ncbi:MAG TPA: 2-oxoacid:acceptor oxidoreductase family protein [Syntrophales bacterium]|nr:2-oxoacid:acceptor oxidoreductase family protein [Syntrophales bacterium]HPO36347.1 2-oxoacid:acceptor oxidoreductase family protein [Syntrophales bacterium]
MMYEFIWHGRGGQGVVLAAQMLAEAAYLHGFKGVTATPTFGPERRGAPVIASTRLSPAPIRTFAQIRKADFAVVLDESLFQAVDILTRLKEAGVLIVNTAEPGKFSFPASLTVFTVDGTGIAHRHRLVREGTPLVNVPLLGAVARASGLVSVEDIVEALKKKIGGDHLTQNVAALKAAFDEALRHG